MGFVTFWWFRIACLCNFKCPLAAKCWEYRWLLLVYGSGILAMLSHDVLCAIKPFEIQLSSASLGCCVRPTVNNSASKLSKELGPRRHLERKQSLSEDFWTTSMCDMDNSAVQSQGSVSSLGTNNQILDIQGGGGNANAPSEFVNHGLLLWNQTRQRWVGNKKSENRTHQVREPKLNWNATYESLLGSNKPFSQPIPLSEMVDFLVDVWEQEGMYD